MFLLKLFFLISVLVVFKAWFTIQLLSAGDWPFLFEENIRDFFFIPVVRPGAYFPLDFFYQSTAKILNSLGLRWILIGRLVWFWPFLILTVFSSWYLARTLFPKEKIIHFFTPFIYLFNTYILMVVGGGQMGVAMAYTLAPLVLGVFIKTIQTSSVKRQTIAGLTLALQAMFDLRIAYLTMGAVFLYAVFSYRLTIKNYWRAFALPILISLSLHFYWLLPMLKMGQPVLPATHNEPGWVGFLSFANFSESFSLLHPNWPENIFGKTYLMRPEFILLPILAFGSLLFIGQLMSSRVKKLKNPLINNSLMKNKQSLLLRNKIIIYFALLALIGAFLAKGSNPPFGEIYIWLFKYFPGMVMFRDSSKFYTLIALSYSLLVPLSIVKICGGLKKKFGRPLNRAFLLFVACCLLFLIRPAWLGQLGGTFKAKEVPQEYILLKDFIHGQKESFQILWVPCRQRFGFSSNNHRAVVAMNYVEDNKCLEPFCGLRVEEYNREYFQCYPNEKCFPADASFLANPEVVDVLTKLSVKYVVIPYDSESEIFLWERQYDPEHRQKLEDFLDTIPWLEKIELSPKIAVYGVVD